MSVLRMPVLAALVLIFAGCARHHEPIAIVAAPAPVAYVPAPPAISPINRDLSPAATLWHFRVALNVAALACRGASETAIIADYNAILREQKSALAAAQGLLAAEYRARGGDWQDAYDDSMTRLYNFFSQAQARDAFCTAAAQVLAEARTVPAAAIGEFASQRLAALDAPFVRAFDPRPVIALAAVSPMPVPAPVRAATPPRLQVNVAALGE